MSSSIQPLIRYRTIHERLRHKTSGAHWEDLAAACGVALREYISSYIADPSRRTIMYDISTMRSGRLGYTAPIKYDRKSKVYYYADPFFQITDSPIKEEDMAELRQALVILRQFSGFEQLQGIEGIITKLAHTVDQSSMSKDPIVQFEQAANRQGDRWLDELYQKVAEKSTVELSYQPFHYETPVSVTVSPYLLKEFNNRWFLIALNHKRDLIFTYALDRIRAIHSSGHHFIQRNYQQQFDNVIGVSVNAGARIQKVSIATTKAQANYIETKPLHHSQHIEYTENERVVFSFQLMPNYELESALLAFGDKIEVLEPASLRGKIQSRLAHALQQYSSKK